MLSLWSAEFCSGVGSSRCPYGARDCFLPRSQDCATLVLGYYRRSLREQTNELILWYMIEMPIKMLVDGSGKNLSGWVMSQEYLLTSSGGMR